MITKAELRREIAEKRRHLDPAWRIEASQQIADRLRRHEVFNAARTIALYKAIAGEVVLESLFPVCWAAGKQTCIPIYNAERNVYEMARISEETRFNIGNYGIQEPVSPSLVSMEEIDLVIVPGVAFDAAGNRLGRGGGYYDRLLAGFTGVSIAVAFDFQIVPEIPCDSRDIPVDGVLTEKKILKL